jgi:hypothetical protein
MFYLTGSWRVLECFHPSSRQDRFGLSLDETDRIARVIERDFELLPESRDVHDSWRQLLVARNLRGVQVHDARLAAHIPGSNR